MGHQVLAYAFINQQAPDSGQICLVQVLDTITNTSKYRIRYLPSKWFGKRLDDDCRSAARFGTKLPEQLAQAMLAELGETVEPPIPVD